MQNWGKLGRMMKLIRKLGTRVNKNGNLESWGLFKCDITICDKEVERPLGNGLKAKSCGCNRIESIKKHGETKTKLYTIWAEMKYRCNNQSNKRFIDWGGRGITVCDEWLDF